MPDIEGPVSQHLDLTLFAVSASIAFARRAVRFASVGTEEEKECEGGYDTGGDAAQVAEP